VVPGEGGLYGPVPRGRAWEMTGRHPYEYCASICDAKPRRPRSFCALDTHISSYLVDSDRCTRGQTAAVSRPACHGLELATRRRHPYEYCASICNAKPRRRRSFCALDTHISSYLVDSDRLTQGQTAAVYRPACYGLELVTRRRHPHGFCALLY